MNHFGHIEIPTTNFEIAKTFFGYVFGWTYQDVPKIEYVLFKAGMKPNGGFFKVKKMPKTNQVNVYIEETSEKLKIKLVLQRQKQNIYKIMITQQLKSC